MKIILAALVLGLLVGCSSQQIAQRFMDDDPTIVKRSAEYQKGFTDGCRSGIKENKAVWGVTNDEFVRDEERMKTDYDYSLGWNDGARRCNTGGGGGFFYVAPRR